MSRVAWMAFQPFEDVGSDLTSDPIAIGDSIAWTALAEDNGGSSIITAQVSNWTGRDAGAAPERTFASHLTAAEAETMVGDAGFRYVRFIRTNSDVTVDLNKMMG